MRSLIVYSLVSTITLASSLFASETSKYDPKGAQPIKTYKLELDQSRTIVLRGIVSDSNIDALDNRFKELATENAKPIFLIIDSPGGSVDAGMRLINTIRAARKELNLRTTCIIEHHGYSIAAVISTFCARTYMLKTASLLYHEASYGIEGSATINLNRVLALSQQIAIENNMIAAALKMSPDLYYSLILHELWLTGPQACAYGIVDGLIDSIYYTAKAPTVNPLLKRAFCPVERICS